MSKAHLALTRDAFGRLLLTVNEGATHSVTPVRNFPITHPDRGISFMSLGGAEIAWLEDLNELPEAERDMVRQELANREFTPEILQLLSISRHATPSRWKIVTDRGETELVLKGEEDIRRLSARALLIADYQGVQYLVRDIDKLDRYSRRLLDYFL